MLLHKHTTVALRIIKDNTEDCTNQNFNYGTEDKVTHISSTVLTFMFLLNGESIKSQVRSLPVSFQKQGLLPRLYHDNKHVHESIYLMFCHISNDPTMFRAKTHHDTPRAKARLPIGLAGVHPKLIAMLLRSSLSYNN